MEKKLTAKEAEQKNGCSAFDEKWMKHWKERQRPNNENEAGEIADMDHSDFSLLLQEIEHR